MMVRFLGLVAACAAAVPIAGAEKREDPSLLTVARIFASGEFQSQAFSARWLKDGSGYLTLEASQSGSGGRDIVLYDPETGRREVMVTAAHLVPPGASSPLAIDDYWLSDDRSRVLIYTNSKRVWRRKTRGDYWVLDRASRELWKLGGDAKPATLMFAKFSPTGRHVAYVRENNLYVEDLRDRRITALTTSGSDRIINGTFDWVYEEEFALRDGFRWSPDGRSIAYWQIDTCGVPRFSLINNTDALYPRVFSFAYPKAGQRNSACRVGVVGVEGGPTRWIATPGDPRNHYIARMSWPRGLARPVLQQFNRLQNTNRVFLADPATGAVEPLLVERDDAWVDVHDEMRWLDDGRRFTWLSERDGWRHIYLGDRSGQGLRRVTAGGYDVIRLLSVDEKSGWIYFLASPERPTDRYLYRIRIDGTGRQRLTPADQEGTHEYQISPDTRWAIHRWSSFASPPVVELVTLPDHAVKRRLVANERLREKLGKLRPCATEFFRVDIGDGVELDAWCIRPPGFNRNKKYPLLIHVYGEPAGQTVVNRWGGKNYLWHWMLAQRGYVIMSFDNRGTPAPRGRAWRKVIYRQVGILAPAEQAAALKAVLADRPYLDPKRVGIWGWSGGGSMSLHAIFKHPGSYAMAMAVAPVANQRYYDTIYQERYMGLPGDNVDGYLRGSPINFAHQLQGHLLIVHGTGDDNVHYQGTEALVNELIRCNKPFTMMVYPNRSHSIREGANTTRHLRELLTRYLQQTLPP